MESIDSKKVEEINVLLQKRLIERIKYLEIKLDVDTLSELEINDYNDEIYNLQKIIININNIPYIKACPKREEIILAIVKIQIDNKEQLKDLQKKQQILWNAHLTNEQSYELNLCILKLDDINFEVRYRERMIECFRCLQNGFLNNVINYITNPGFYNIITNNN